jgi:hypothetical protein
MVVVCHLEASTAVPRTHNLAGVPVTRCLDVALRTSLTWPETMTEVRPEVRS